MENKEMASQNGLSCESAPIFDQISSIPTSKPVIADGKDKGFAFIYLLLGYSLYMYFRHFPILTAI